MTSLPSTQSMYAAAIFIVLSSIFIGKGDGFIFHTGFTEFQTQKKTSKDVFFRSFGGAGGIKYLYLSYCFKMHFCLYSA